MKTPTSSESGYFYPRISAASLLCICGVWLAAISFAPSALAWGITYAGSPGYVTWGSDANNPIIAMGYNSPGSADFSITYPHLPTIGTSSAGTDWQYAYVTLYVYYSCDSGWCLWSWDTKVIDWLPKGATATLSAPPRVSPIYTTGTYYWTSLIQIIWYNDMRYTSSQQAAWENFYPDNTDTTGFDYVPGGTPPGNQWYGNADMAIAAFAEVLQGAGKPWGPAYSYNLNSPTGYIYVLEGLKNN